MKKGCIWSKSDNRILLIFKYFSFPLSKFMIVVFSLINCFILIIMNIILLIHKLFENCNDKEYDCIHVVRFKAISLSLNVIKFINYKISKPCASFSLQVARYLFFDNDKLRWNSFNFIWILNQTQITLNRCGRKGKEIEMQLLNLFVLVKKCDYSRVKNVVA